MIVNSGLQFKLFGQAGGPARKSPLMKCCGIEPNPFRRLYADFKRPLLRVASNVEEARHHGFFRTAFQPSGPHWPREVLAWRLRHDGPFAAAVSYQPPL